jgi:UrcA family protein
MRTSLIAVGAMLVVTGTAFAQPPVVVTRDTAPSAIVSYADLNIWSDAGQERLVNRIRAAATDICFESNKVEVKVAVAQHSCFNTALGSGLKQMNMAIAARPGTLATSTLIVSAR